MANEGGFFQIKASIVGWLKPKMKMFPRLTHSQDGNFHITRDKIIVYGISLILCMNSPLGKEPSQALWDEVNAAEVSSLSSKELRNQVPDNTACSSAETHISEEQRVHIEANGLRALVRAAARARFDGPSVYRLTKRLFTMRMSANGSVVDHLNDFNGVTNQLEYVGINFDDEIRAFLFLCSLPDSWNKLVKTVSNSTVSGTLTLNDVVSSMMNDKMQRKMIVDGISSSTALSVESRGMKNVQLDFCEGCVYGKQKQVSFWRDGKEKKTERLKLVHTDVCGPTTVKKSNECSQLWYFGRRMIRLQEHGIEKENREYMKLDEPKDGQVPRIEYPEVLDETTDTEFGAGNQQQKEKSENREHLEVVWIPQFDALFITKNLQTKCRMNFKNSHEK
ncbi:hypothetical protein RJ640_000320 [Escallonia rubra]|uniref:GAG-pre-integrase domain-containing protein n=1 Tax=Escallonia rubra TaxID=112253 RepID=A0AA88UP56_9ASTE|nr:hypothetical protein RJ640_000320 [Escallonia rubra]